MPVVNCPSCARPLSIGQNLAGANVRCPGCQTIFLAPAAARATAPPAPPPLAAPVSRKPPTPRPVVRQAAPAPVPPPPAEANPFDFGGAATAPTSPNQAFQFEQSDDAGYGRIRVRARTAAAANWMTMGSGLLFLDSLGAVVMVVTGMAGGPSIRAGEIGAVVVMLLVLLAVMAVFVYAPMIVIALGARSLRSQRSYALAMTGAVLAVIVSVPTLLGGGGWFLFSLWLLALALANRPAAAGLVLIPLAVAAFLLATGICCLTGAIQSFRALAHPEVSEAFRRRRQGGG